MRYAIRSLGLFLMAALAGAAPLAQAQQMEVLGLAADSAPTLNSADFVQVQHGCDEPDWCRGYPGWYASGDAVFLKRGGPRKSPLIIADRGGLNDSTNDMELYTASSLHFIDYEGGFRTELGRCFGNGLALEGTVLVVDEWDTVAQFTSNGVIAPTQPAEGLSPPLQNNRVFYRSRQFDMENAGTFYQALQQTVYYKSDLTSAEMNLKATWQHGQFIRSEYIGLRYVQVREHFALVSQDEADSTPGNGFGTYSVDTDNDLIGGQYGQEIGMQLFGCALLTTRLKAGMFVNMAEQETRIVDNLTERYNARDQEEELAFVGEINVGLNVRVNKVLSVRAGYNCMWVEGIALAAEQGYPVAFTGVSPINRNGDLFYHGFNVGLQLSR